MPDIRSNFSLHRYTLDTPYPVGPVHVYLLKRGGGYVLVDTGPPTPSCFSYLKKNLPLDKLEYVLITHSHADHSGAAEFIENHSNAKILVPRKDILKVKLSDAVQRRLREVLLSLGFTERAIDLLKWAVVSLKDQEGVSKNAIAVEESELPQGISYDSYPGHSLTDFVYIIDNRYAITGDFLLDGIFQTPLIEIDPDTMEMFDNYVAYCDSISRLGNIMSYKIFPAHRELEHPLDAVKFYVDKVLKRARFMHECLKKSCTIFEAVKELTNPYENPFKAYMKASELVFLRSFLNNPTLLVDSLRKLGILDIFEKRVEELF